jgi:hypothetical protein
MINTYSTAVVDVKLGVQTSVSGSVGGLAEVAVGGEGKVSDGDGDGARGSSSEERTRQDGKKVREHRGRHRCEEREGKSDDAGGAESVSAPRRRGLERSSPWPGIGKRSCSRSRCEGCL